MFDKIDNKTKFINKIILGTNNFADFAETVLMSQFLSKYTSIAKQQSRVLIGKCSLMIAVWQVVVVYSDNNIYKNMLFSNQFCSIFYVSINT